jgi:hypothetical protein
MRSNRLPKGDRIPSRRASPSILAARVYLESGSRAFPDGGAYADSGKPGSADETTPAASVYSSSLGRLHPISAEQSRAWGRAPQGVFRESGGLGMPPSR